MQPSVRSLDQVLAELSPIYDPQVNAIRSRQAEIPGQMQAEEAGLDAKKNVAFDSILGGARQRGIGFSGIPLGEQAKYTATDYLPAVARLRTQGREQARSLEDAIMGINERKNTAALGMRQYEQQRYDNYVEQLRREEEARRLEAQKATAASANSFSPTMGGGGGVGGGQPQQAPQASIAKKQNGGFAFADAGGKPISAATYAKLNGQDIRDVLHLMGSNGDTYSQQLYNQLARDPFFGKGNAKYDQQIYKTYSPIFWGAY